MLADERKDTAAEFWKRANTWFKAQGIMVRKVLTDNGSCYRSHAFREALGDGIEHRRTRPYRPQTNVKVERFHRTLADEWAYARLYTSDEQRCAEHPLWLHTTITTAATQHSAVSHQPAVYLTCQVSTHRHLRARCLILGDHALPDSPGGVPLLARGVLVAQEPGVDHRWPTCRSLGGNAPDSVQKSKSMVLGTYIVEIHADIEPIRLHLTMI